MLSPQSGSSGRPIGWIAALLGAVLLPSAAARPAVAHCEVDKVLASDGAPGDAFGYSVSISGDLAIVGTPFDQDNGPQSGSAYVYRYCPVKSRWVQEAKLLASDGSDLDVFGWSVGISDGVAVVGAYADDDIALNSGSAYVFRLDPELCAWIEETKLLASDGGFVDAFGLSVGISDDVIVVGAPLKDGEQGTNTGSAYVFRFHPDAPPGSGWVEEAKLVASDGTANDFFGDSVAIDGHAAIIGVFGDDDHGTGSGSAYIFRFDGHGWREEAKLLDADGAPFDNFGDSVSISGDVALAGAPDDDDLGGLSGSAFVFRRDSGSSTWSLEAHLLASDGEEADYFGAAVGVSGNVALVGAPGRNDSGIDSGAAYLYRYDGSTWAEQAKILASDSAPDDAFGAAAAVSGDVAIVGADKDDDNGSGSGSAYLLAGLAAVDCNDNKVADACDIAGGTSGDSNGNGIPDECDCPWDLDGSGVVGVIELLSLLTAWGTDPGGPPDFNGDGDVGVVDLLALLAAWGPCAPP